MVTGAYRPWVPGSSGRRRPCRRHVRHGEGRRRVRHGEGRQSVRHGEGRQSRGCRVYRAYEGRQSRGCWVYRACEGRQSRGSRVYRACEGRQSGQSRGGRVDGRAGQVVQSGPALQEVNDRAVGVDPAGGVRQGRQRRQPLLGSMMVHRLFWMMKV